MSPTESLTVEIRADSSHLESELQRVGSLVDGLSSRLGGVTQAVNGASRALSGVATAIGPITQVEGVLGRVAARLAEIRQTTVTIDVAPALAGLRTLSSQLMRVLGLLGQLNSVSGRIRGGPLPTSIGGGGLSAVRGSGGNSSGRGSGTPQRFAGGGFVDGPQGTDRVAAYVTAGEFVLRPEVVNRVGRPFLDQLNANANRFVKPRSRSETPPMPLSRERMARSGSTSDVAGRVSQRELVLNVHEPSVQNISISMSQAVELDDVLSQIDLARSRAEMRVG